MTRLEAAARKAEKKLGVGYLRTPEGKRLLKKARQMDLRWPELTRIFRRGQTTLEKAFSFHGIRREHPKFLNWNQKLLDIVKKFYQKSVGIQGVSDSTRLSLEMLREVNAARRKQGLKNVSMNAIRCFAKDLKMRWGWNNWKGKSSFSSEEKQILRRYFAGASWVSLFSLLPGRKKWEINACAKKMGLKRPRALYSPAEVEILQKAIENLLLTGSGADFESVIRDLRARLKRPAGGILNKMEELGFKYRPPWRERKLKVPGRMWNP